MCTVMKNIKEVQENDILGEDIYSQSILLANKGTILSKTLINLLKRRNIQEIKVIMNQSQPPIHSSKEVLNLSDGEQDHSQDTEHTTHRMFNRNLSIVGTEGRYGRILNNHNDVDLLIQLFSNITCNDDLLNKFHALKNWDYYTFIHSFDVFILGTLLARNLGIHHLDIISRGYLFHDIGKLKISQDLLHKQGKLSFREFEIVKRHSIEGEGILRSLGDHEIAHFARSHHERVNGLGYPDKLTEKDLSKELKILQIVDVYSALTLKRPYSDALPAQEALEILIRDVDMFDKGIVYKLIESLAIYPRDATVLLSDYTVAKVHKVTIPTMPELQRLSETDRFSLPLDLSTTILKIIDSQSEDFQTRYLKFFNCMIQESKDVVDEAFSQLIDGLRLEEVYTEVLLPAYWKANHLLNVNDMNREKYQLCISVLTSLSEQIEQELMKLYYYQFKTLLLVEGLTDLFPIQVISGLLHVEYIFPLVIASPSSDLKIEQYITNNHIKSVCVIHSSQFEKTIVQKYSHLSSLDIDLVYRSSKDLTQIFKEIYNTKERGVRFYDLLFRHSAFAD